MCQADEGESQEGDTWVDGSEDKDLQEAELRLVHTERVVEGARLGRHRSYARIQYRQNTQLTF